MPDVNQMRRYRAFLSYRHADNAQEGRRWAEWLHRSLECYVVPSDLVGSPNLRGELIPESLYPIFRDEDELPAEADLAAGIRRALEQSDCMIVLCSPRSAQSPWVRQEVRQFKELGNSDRILAVILAGEPNADDPVKIRDGVYLEEECFPRELRFGVAVQDQLNAAGHPVIDWEKRTEPLAADLRPQGRRAEGFTSAAAYKEYLRLQTSLDAEKIGLYTKAYGEQLERSRLKIIAGVLSISLSQLEDRDARHRAELAEKEAQRQKEIADRERSLAEQARQTTRRLARRNCMLVAAMFVVGILALVAVLETFLARQGRAFSQARKLYSQATDDLNAGRQACSQARQDFDQASQSLTNLEMVVTNDIRREEELGAGAHRISEQLEQDARKATSLKERLGTIHNILASSTTNYDQLAQQLPELHITLQKAQKALRELDSVTRHDYSNDVSLFNTELPAAVTALDQSRSNLDQLESELSTQLHQQREVNLKLIAIQETQPRTLALVIELTNQVDTIREALNDIHFKTIQLEQQQDNGRSKLLDVQDSLDLAEMALGRTAERLLASNRHEPLSLASMYPNLRHIEQVSMTMNPIHLELPITSKLSLSHVAVGEVVLEYPSEPLTRIVSAITAVRRFQTDLETFGSKIGESQSLIDEITGEINSSLEAAQTAEKNAGTLFQDSQDLTNEVGVLKKSSAIELTKAMPLIKSGSELCAKADLLASRINQANTLVKGLIPVFDGAKPKPSGESPSKN